MKKLKIYYAAPQKILPWISREISHKSPLVELLRVRYKVENDFICEIWVIVVDLCVEQRQG